ncbi:MAG: AMP-binding protein [Pseudomonadota bacterium]
MSLKYDFSGWDRDYATAKDTFRIDIPEDFNFAFDVIDDRGTKADKTALVCFDADGSNLRRVSFSDLSKASNRFGKALLKLGVGKGDYAVVLAGRIPEWHEALFGCMKAGVVSMPGTNLLTAKDIAYRVNRSGAKAAIVAPQHVDKIDAIRADCPTLEVCITFGEPSDGWHGYADLCAAESDQAERTDFPATGAADEMMTYFTSGTTSLPKMVPRDYGYALAHAASALFWMDLSESDVHWAVTDTGWAKAAWGLLFPPLLMGAAVVMHDAAPGFDSDVHLKMIPEIGATTLCAPPTVYRIFAQIDLSDHDLSSLKRSISAGEPLNPEVIRYWKEHTCSTIAEGYGQTETIAVVGNHPGQEVRAGSMGLPTPGFDVDAVDDDGNRCAEGEIGHIAIRTDGEWPPGLFRGYRTEDGLETRPFRNGWYYSGDTATRDADGYLWFVGRSDDIISSSGYRISPFEVESALIEHPAVAESAVVAKPDEARGEIVKAFIILAPGHEGSDDLATEIQDFCKRITAPFKYPREVEFVSALPKTISGKIRRVELRGEG